MKRHPMPDRELVASRLSYDPETGLLVNRVTGLSNRVPKRGYIPIMVGGTIYYAHRLAWLLHYGTWPDVIDHINGDRSDNRISNLRAVSTSINVAMSTRKYQNSSGVKGVSKHALAERWRAYINVEGRRIELGLFPSAEAAAAARKEAEFKYWPQPKQRICKDGV